MYVGFHLKVMKCTFTRGALYFVAEMCILYVVVSNDNACSVELYQGYRHELKTTYISFLLCKLRLSVNTKF